MKFRDEYFFLSNFYPVPIKFSNRLYPTVEHAYQAAKVVDDQTEEAIRHCRTPGQAKRYPKPYIRSDWDYIKLGVMRQLIF